MQPERFATHKEQEQFEKDRLDLLKKKLEENTEAIAKVRPGLVQLSEDLTVIKIFLREAAEKIQAGGKSRCRSLAVTKIDEARMWLDEEMRTP